jgi:hypothetical protein
MYTSTKHDSTTHAAAAFWPDVAPGATRAMALALLAALALTFTGCKKKSSPTQPVVVTQPSRSTIVPLTTSGYVEARTSQIVTDGALPAAVFDDFTFASASTIKTVSWQGIYCVQTAGSPAPAPTASAFTVSIFADASGRPNTAAPLQTSTYPIAQTAQTFEKNQGALTCGTAMNTTWPFYKYSVTLNTPFSASANTKYWLSVQATTPSYAVYWGWRDGTVDNSSSLQLFNGTYTTFAIDRAYSLVP